jgi:phage-related minor tail protein
MDYVEKKSNDLSKLIDDNTEKIDDYTRDIEKSFSNLTSNSGKQISQLVSDLKSAANEIQSAVDDINSALSSIGSFSGGVNVSFGARASGGPVFSGSPYLVGEEGPELFMPKSNGYIIDAEETADLFGGGRGDIVINIQGDVYDDERSMRNKLKSAVIDVLEEQVAYG